MSPEDRYKEIREQTDIFRNKFMMKSILIKHFAEAEREAYQKALEVADRHTGCGDPECLSNRNCAATIVKQIYELSKAV